MKGIVFRGKRKDWEKYPQDEWWVKGYVWIGADSAFIIPENAGLSHDEKISFASVPVIEVEPRTVGQYSFLNDKKDKRIFEGDIVTYQFDNDDCPFPNKDTKQRIGRVFFQDWRASFALAEGRNGSDMCNQDLYCYVRGGNRTEVIGNIFDNPELLKEGDTP